MGFENVMGLNTELCLDSDGKEIIGMDQDKGDGSKNRYVAGIGERARLLS